eukprot:113332_1
MASPRLVMAFTSGVGVGIIGLWNIQPSIAKRNRTNALSQTPGKAYDHVGIFHRSYLQNKYDIKGAMQDKSMWDAFMTIDTKFVYQVCMGDNKLTDSELKSLYKIQSLYGMTEDHITSVLNECKQKPLSIVEFKEMFESNPFSQTAFKMGRSQKKHATCALLSSLEIAFADGLDAAEFQSSKQIANIAGISDDEMNRVSEALYLEWKLLNLYDESFMQCHLRPPPMYIIARRRSRSSHIHDPTANSILPPILEFVAKNKHTNWLINIPIMHFL